LVTTLGSGGRAAETSDNGQMTSHSNPSASSSTQWNPMNQVGFY
jgi:hypothetical protein